MDEKKRRRISVWLYILQMLAAFGMVFFFFILYFYSYVRGPGATGVYHLDFFSESRSFEETSTFYQILRDTASGIFRYNVTRGQLEDENGEINGKKEIDIKAFANRKSADTEKGIVCYRLADLLNWAEEGIMFATFPDMTEEEFVNFFHTKSDWEELDGILNEYQRTALYTYLGPVANILLVNDEENLPMHELFANLLMENEGKHLFVYVDENGNVLVQVNYLVERYTPSNSDSLLNTVGSWSEYFNYLEWLQTTLSDLQYNYNEYLTFDELYGRDATNIAYAVEFEILGKTVKVDNLDRQITGREATDSYFKENFEKYLIYKPKNVEYETNLNWTRQQFKNFLSDYSYAYTGDCAIYMGIDTDYPADDSLRLASIIYRRMRPLVPLCLIMGCLCTALWLALLIGISIRTDAAKRRWYDKIYTEVLLAAAFFTVLAVCLVLSEVSYYSFTYALAGRINRVWYAAAAGALGLFCSSILCTIWYALLHKLKGRYLFKDSLLIQLGRYAGRMLTGLYENRGVIFRTLLTVGTTMAVNIFGVYLIIYFHVTGSGYMRIVSERLLIAADALILYLFCRGIMQRRRIVEGIRRIAGGELSYQMPTERLYGENKRLAEAANEIGKGIQNAVEISMKDERLKADLITNVSHDIKTPLTSIINYVDLLKREEFDSESVRGYIEVLDTKSQRLKKLTEDLVEASKISSGNIVLHLEKIDLAELLRQALGEFNERFSDRRLTLIECYQTEHAYIEADSGRIWRVVENLLGNICKYALEGTRVYMDLEQNEEAVSLSLKNISAQALNIPAEELTERFMRGDDSRSMEGSGLGLSIAKNLTELQKGSLTICLDGDLFKVILRFPVYPYENQ